MKHKHTLFGTITFHAKDGRTIEASHHVATFNGTHNAAKSKVFLALYNHRFKVSLKGISAIELHRQSGVPYGYIRSRLIKWVEWQYIKRAVDIINGKPVYIYSIDDRGRHFVEDIIPIDARNRYVEEIKAFKNTLVAKSKDKQLQHDNNVIIS